MYTFTQYWLVLPVFELYTNRCGSDGKESACIAGLVSVPGLGRLPGEGNGYLLLVFLRGKFHRQRSLAGYSPWGCRVRHDWATNKNYVAHSWATLIKLLYIFKTIFCSKIPKIYPFWFMQYAIGPFYVSFMPFIITLVKHLIIWSWNFIYSVHRYLGYLKCVALINNVAENILISITIAT